MPPARGGPDLSLAPVDARERLPAQHSDLRGAGKQVRALCQAALHVMREWLHAHGFGWCSSAVIIIFFIHHLQHNLDLRLRHRPLPLWRRLRLMQHQADAPRALQVPPPKQPAQYADAAASPGLQPSSRGGRPFPPVPRPGTVGTNAYLLTSAYLCGVRGQRTTGAWAVAPHHFGFVQRP